MVMENTALAQNNTTNRCRNRVRATKANLLAMIQRMDLRALQDRVDHLKMNRHRDGDKKTGFDGEKRHQRLAPARPDDIAFEESAEQDIRQCNRHRDDGSPRVC